MNIVSLKSNGFLGSIPGFYPRKLRVTKIIGNPFFRPISIPTSISERMSGLVEVEEKTFYVSEFYIPGRMARIEFVLTIPNVLFDTSWLPDYQPFCELNYSRPCARLIERR